MKRLIAILLLSLLPSTVALAGLDPRMMPAMDYYSEYISGGGIVYGNLYMRGNDIYLDADDDSRLELGTDDKVSVYLNSSLILELDEFGLEATMVTITESGEDDRALYISATLNDTGAVDGTEEWTGVLVDATLTDTTGWASTDMLHLIVDTATVLRVDSAGVQHGANAETWDNSTDGSWTMTGVGSTYNEDVIYDLEGDNIVEIGTSTGVATHDYGAIGLACGTVDLSDGNLTNGGDLQIDSLTADGTALQSNSSTWVFQQNADLASGNFATFDGEADAELTASSGSQSFVRVAPEVLQTGTSNYVALEVDATESSIGSGVDFLLSLEVADAVKLRVGTGGVIHGVSTDTLHNSTAGSWVMTGVSGSNNEDLEIDLEATADVVTLRSSTGVATWDWEAIGLACGTADISEGNITNAGDVQADSVTADGTALQTNSSTLILQQNADLASGNAITMDSHVDAELTAASGTQSYLKVAPEILQTSTAAYIALEVDVTESSEGSVTDYLMSLEVGDVAKLTVDSDGALACVDATMSGTVAVDALTPEADNGVGLTGTTITESGNADSTLFVEHTLNDTGAPDATEDYTALKVNVTETDDTGWATVNLLDLQVDTVSKFLVDDTGAATYAGGMSMGGELDMNSNNIVEVGTLGFQNSETIGNAVDGQLAFTGVGGGSNNESAILDFETTADTIGVGTGTGVTTWDWGAIGLACGTADLSEGNLTNAGDVQLDSLTADGTGLQTNATTTIVQQNADVASGNFLEIDSHADAELTAATGSQSFTRIAPEILQTGTGSWTALEIDVTETSEGSVTDYLLSLEVADAAKLTVDSDGELACVNADFSGTLSATGEVDFTADVALTAGGAITTTSDGDLDLTPNGTGVVDVTDAEVYIGDGTYSWDHTPILACEGILEIDGATHLDSTLGVAGATSLADSLTLDDSGTSVNSPIISLKGDSAGTEVEGQIQVMYGENPYVRISVDDDHTTPVMTGVIDIHDVSISFVNDNTTDIGASGASRPKNYYGAGSITVGGSMSGVGGDFGDGAITNVGDVQLDSLTADGTALQTNSTTLTLQQNADVVSGDFLTVDSHVDAELTASSGVQSFMSIKPEILQTGTGGYTALLVDSTQSSVGSGDKFLMDLAVGGSTKTSVSSTGILTTVYVSINGAGSTLAFTPAGVEGAKFRGDTNTDALFLGVDEDFARLFILGASANVALDYEHATQDNPTMFFHSVIAPAVSKVQWASMTHDQTDAVLGVGLGSLHLSMPEITESGTLDKGLNVTQTLNDPGAADASEDSALIYGLLTLTDVTGYDETDLLRLDTGAGEVFAVDSDGVTTMTAMPVLPAYTAAVHIPAGSAALGPNAPDFLATTGGTSGGLGFDAANEVVYLDFEIPGCWDGTDMALKIYWTNLPGDAVAAGETVKWDSSFRSVIWGTEASDNNVAGAETVTYTQGGGGDADGATYVHTHTLDFDDGTQPLSVGDDVTIAFARDTGVDTYSGQAIAIKWEVEYTATGICDHH